MTTKLTTQEFIYKASKVHDNKYTYDKTKYVNAKTKLIVTCVIHGDFQIIPNNHMNGRGCQACGYTNNKKNKTNTFEEVIGALIKVHGSKYSISRESYTKRHSHSYVLCNSCNKHFCITVHNLLNGRGCPFCSISGFSKEMSASLYVLRFEDLLKIGITNRKVKHRVRQINSASKKNFEIIYEVFSENGEHIYLLEKFLLNNLRQMYKQPTEKFDGFTECFYDIDEDRLLNEIEEHLEGYDNGSD